MTNKSTPERLKWAISPVTYKTAFSIQENDFLSKKTKRVTEIF